MNWKKNNGFIFLTYLFVIAIFLFACEKERDMPPIRSLDPNSIITIDSLIKIYQYYGEAVTFNDAFFENEEKNPTGVSEYNIYATVTMSQESGNIYRQAFIQDTTAAINVRFTRTNLLEGDSIRINIRGTTISDYNKMIQLDSVDSYQNVVRLKGATFFPPEEVSIPDILAGNHMAKLVKLDDVQFIAAHLGTTFADAANLASVSRDLEDCMGNKIIVRTSGYADFANKMLPSGKGSLVAVVTLYRPSWQNFDTWQLTIRRYEEIDMAGARCGEVDGVLILSENFNMGSVGEAIDFNGWKSIALAGTRHWITSTDGSKNYAQVTAHNSGEESNIVWLTSPQINAQTYQSASLTFETAHHNYVHDGLSVFVSYNYNGTDPSAATWTELTANIASSSTNAGVWVGSGIVDIINSGKNFHLGFKYTGSGTDELNTLFRLDNIKVYGID